MTAILGPNGAGKTTTIEICEGYRHADSGRIRVLASTRSRRPHVRPRIGVMLQSGGFPGEVRRRVAAARSPALCPAAGPGGC